MDYRERKYYLIHTAFFYDEYIDKLKSLIPSLKIHPPYNHFRNNENINYLNDIRRKNGYEVCDDIDIHDLAAGYGYASNMISCRIEESQLLDEICKSCKTKFHFHPDFRWMKLVELTKDICNQ